MTVTLITHSAPGDDFWDLVRKGAEDAAKKDCIALEYQASPDGAEQANLVNAAVDKKVDGIAVTLGKPDQMGAAVRAAVTAGIPVTALNGGVDVWQDLGVIGFFGQEDRVAGQKTGEKLKAEGAKKVLCVLHEQGNVGNDARCAGVKQVLPSTENLYVNGVDQADVQTKITAKLQQDSSIDTVLSPAPNAVAFDPSAIRQARPSSWEGPTTAKIAASVVGGIPSAASSGTKWKVTPERYADPAVNHSASPSQMRGLRPVGGGSALAASACSTVSAPPFPAGTSSACRIIGTARLIAARHRTA